MAYNYIEQPITNTLLVQPYANDAFYNPGPNNLTGYAADGNFYLGGMVQQSQPQASWFTEEINPYRAIGYGIGVDGRTFPTAGLILLSPVSLVILDQSNPTRDAFSLPLWMQFLLGDTLALTDNFDGNLNGWEPTDLTYANGKLTISYSPDPGSTVTSTMALTIDFTQDKVYLDVAIANPVSL